MGAAMSITAFPVLARILVERRLLRSKVGAVDHHVRRRRRRDGVVHPRVRRRVVRVGERAPAPCDDGGSPLGYIVVDAAWSSARFLAPPRRVARTRGAHARTSSPSSSCCCSSRAALTELIGIHALFGAFVCRRHHAEGGRASRTALADKLEDLVVVLLLPLFFAYSGLRTADRAPRRSRRRGSCAALIILVACVGKFGGQRRRRARSPACRWRESARSAS